MLEAELGDVHESKNVDKCQICDFDVGRFWNLWTELWKPVGSNQQVGDSLTENSLNPMHSVQVLINLEAKFENVTEEKVVDNYQTYNFAFWRFWSVVEGFGEKCIAI